MKRASAVLFGIVMVAMVAAGCSSEGNDFRTPASTGVTPPVQVTPEATLPGFGTQGEAKADSVEVKMLGVKVQVVARGYLQDGCTKITDIIQKREGNTFTVTLRTFRPANVACIQVAPPFERTIDLDVAGLKAGAYTVEVGGAKANFTLNTDNAP
jgi:inhibitor of cysteine peptidase